MPSPAIRRGWSRAAMGDVGFWPLTPTRCGLAGGAGKVPGRGVLPCRVAGGTRGRRSALRLASAARILQESDRLRPCRDSRILTLRCCLVHSQPGHPELIEVPDFRGMQALNAWLFGHDCGLLLTGPDPDSPQPLLHGVVVDQAPVPGGRRHRLATSHSLDPPRTGGQRRCARTAAASHARAGRCGGAGPAIVAMNTQDRRSRTLETPWVNGRVTAPNGGWRATCGRRQTRPVARSEASPGLRLTRPGAR